MTQTVCRLRRKSRRDQNSHSANPAYVNDPHSHELDKWLRAEATRCGGSLLALQQKWAVGISAPDLRAAAQQTRERQIKAQNNRRGARAPAHSSPSLRTGEHVEKWTGVTSEFRAETSQQAAGVHANPKPTPFHFRANKSAPLVLF